MATFTNNIINLPTPFTITENTTYVDYTASNTVNPVSAVVTALTANLAANIYQVIEVGSGLFQGTPVSINIPGTTENYGLAIQGFADGGNQYGGLSVFGAGDFSVLSSNTGANVYLSYLTIGANTQATQTATLSSAGDNFIYNCDFKLATTITGAGNWYFNNCQFEGILTVDVGFTGIIYFTSCNMSNKAHVFSQSAATSVIFLNSSNLSVSSLAANATFLGANVANSGSTYIRNLPTPVNPSDAATMSYVDTHGGGGSGFTWTTTLPSGAIAPSTGYIVTGTTPSTALTLPATAALGATFKFYNNTTGDNDFVVTVTAPQTIRFGNQTTAASLTSNHTGDVCELVCIDATTAGSEVFAVVSGVGSNLTGA